MRQRLTPGALAAIEKLAATGRAEPCPEHVPDSLLMQWHVTDRCGLSCAHCYQRFSSGHSELGLEGLLAVLECFRRAVFKFRDISAAPFPAHIALTGGEPFERPDIFRLLEKFHEERRIYGYSILSNGHAINDGLASELSKLSPRYVQISLDGGRETHDAVRGAGSFEKALSAVRSLGRAGVRAVVSFTAHAGNYFEFPAVARAAKEHGAAAAWADRLITGPGCGLDTTSPDQSRELFCAMASAAVSFNEGCRTSGVKASRGGSGGSGFAVLTGRALQFLECGGRPYRCRAGDSLVTVMPDGGIVPCRRMPIPCGNVIRDGLLETYRGSALFARLRDMGEVSRGCEKCVYEPSCRGGLKCLSYAKHGDPFVRDPGCYA